MTTEQQAVLERKQKDGYILIGESTSMINGLVVYVLIKNKHTLAINTMGYDEHYAGKSWKLN